MLKKLSDQEFLDLVDRYQLDPDLKNWGNNVWHGMVGIYKIQEDLGLHDSENPASHLKSIQSVLVR